MFFHRSQRLISSIHAYQEASSKITRKWAKLRHRYWSTISGSEIHLETIIDETAYFPHLSGIVIHQSSVIGKKCLIMQNVTIGQSGASKAPKLANNVFVGAGAVLLGEITIGDGAKIGANAVVLQDVPPGVTMVGVPAHISGKSKDDN